MQEAGCLALGAITDLSERRARQVAQAVQYHPLDADERHPSRADEGLGPLTPQQPVGPLSRHGAPAERDGRRRTTSWSHIRCRHPPALGTTHLRDLRRSARPYARRQGVGLLLLGHRLQLVRTALPPAHQRLLVAARWGLGPRPVLRLQRLRLPHATRGLRRPEAHPPSQGDRGHRGLRGADTPNTRMGGEPGSRWTTSRSATSRPPIQSARESRLDDGAATDPSRARCPSRVR